MRLLLLQKSESGKVTQRSVDYRRADDTRGPAPLKNCGRCRYFHAEGTQPPDFETCGHCARVQGRIFADMTCNLFEAKRFQKGQQYADFDGRPLWDDLERRGAILSEICAIYRNRKTGEWWVSVGDWAGDATMAAVKRVLPKATVEAEASPDRHDSDWQTVRPRRLRPNALKKSETQEPASDPDDLSRRVRRLHDAVQHYQQYPAAHGPTDLIHYAGMGHDTFIRHMDAASEDGDRRHFLQHVVTATSLLEQKRPKEALAELKQALAEGD